MKKRKFKKEVLKNIGKRVHEIRLEKNISIQELAKRANLKYSKIKKLDKGYNNIYITDLFKTADALGTKPSDLCIYT